MIEITESATNTTRGPHLTIDSAGDPQIAGAFYVDFFDILTFTGDVELLHAAKPANTKFKFHIAGTVSSLADFEATIVYHSLNYLKVSGSFGVHLTTDSLGAITVKGTKVSNGVDFSKANDGVGVSLNAAMSMTLDATKPTDPDYSMSLSGSFHLKFTDLCQFNLNLPPFTLDVNKNTFAEVPAKAAEQILLDGATIFASVFEGGAGCFVEILKLGFFLLKDTAEIALVLAHVFAEGIEDGAKFLSDLGSAAGDVADALWSIFNSHDNDKNTSAMKKANYSSEETAKAIKKTSDAAGHPYTSRDLVKNQASSGYPCPQVAGGLLAAFTTYGSKPVEAGQLFADSSLTSFNATQVTAGLHASWSGQTQTAITMQRILAQVYTGSSALTAQQMADALAPIYPIADVAGVLNTHYASDVDTAAKMAAILTSTYQTAGAPTTAPALAGALAVYFDATPVATVLHSDFPSDTDTATKLSNLLNSAYVGAKALNVQNMANALAPIFTNPNDIVAPLMSLYAGDTNTAAKMGAILLIAFPSIDVAAMAAALAAGAFPALDIAQVLKDDFGTEAGTPAQMTTLLAAQNYPPDEVAPVLKALWPQQAGTADLVAGFLIAGYPAASITAAKMATALKAAPFSPVRTAPALKSNYTSDTDTAAKMTTLLIDAWKDGNTNTINIADMAAALKGAPYNAAGTSGVGAALKSTYASDLATALDMAKVLNTAEFGLADLSTALTQQYSTTVTDAASLVGVLALVPLGAPTVAPVLKTIYSAALTTAEDMFTVLSAAYLPLTAQICAQAIAASLYDILSGATVLKTHYAPDVSTAAKMFAILQAAYPSATSVAMAWALGGNSYPVSDVAVVLHDNYAADTNTAQKLLDLLKGAYPVDAITMSQMATALGAVAFSALDVAPPLYSTYTPEPAAFGQALVAGLGQSQSLTALPLGVAVNVAGVASNDVAAAVHGGLPATSAGLMAAVLLVAEDINLGAIITSASQEHTIGKTLTQAAETLKAQDQRLAVAALASVYAPPGPTLPDMAIAIAPAAGVANVTGATTGILVQYPATIFDDLWATIDSAYKNAGTTLTGAQLADAIIAAFTYIGEDVAASQQDLVEKLLSTDASTTPGQAATILVSAYRAAATPTSMPAALKGGFVGSPTLVDGRVASVAVSGALSLTETEADKIAAPLASTFGLTYCPQSVGALSVALWKSGFSMNATSAALSGYFGSKWTGDAFAIVGSVYTKAQWGAGVNCRDQAKTLNQAAQLIYADQGLNTDAALNVQVLVAVYDLTDASSAAAVMGTALSGVKKDNAQAYSLNEGSAAMTAHFTDQWTAADFGAFAQAFNKN